MGVSPSAFRKWLKGEAEPSRERLVALARATGVGVAWLAEGEGPAPAFDNPGARRRPRNADSAESSDLGQFTVIPDQRPLTAPSVMSRHLALRTDWLRAVLNVAPEQLTLDFAPDDSMAPTIRQDDALLVDTSAQEAVCAGVYVLEFDRRRVVRRVQRKHDGGLVLLSDNDRYQPDTVEPGPAASVVVVGRVVWAGRKI